MASRPPRRLLVPVLAGALLWGCARGASPPAPSPVPEATTVPTGELGSAAPAGAPFFTAAQADRGRAVFESVCAACHALGEFRGQQFRLTWMARPLRDFVQQISTAMPQDAPGSLTPAQYAAVTAYFLQLHGQPPGSRELPSVSDDLGAMAWPR